MIVYQKLQSTLKKFKSFLVKDLMYFLATYPLDLGLLFSPLAEMEAAPLVESSTSERCGGKLKATPLVFGTLGEDGFDP